MDKDPVITEEEVINLPVEVERLEETPTLPAVQDLTQKSKFANVVEDAKVNIVKDAAARGDKFVREIENELKEAAVTSAQVEKDKQVLERQNIQYSSEVLSTQQEQNKHRQAEDKWENRQKRREYHYNGVKPIMEFVGIKTPMNLPLLYLLTIVLLPFFLLGKLFAGTIGALIAGAQDADRPKAARGFIWTILALLIAMIVALAVYLCLHWLGIVTIPAFAS